MMTSTNVPKGGGDLITGSSDNWLLCAAFSYRWMDELPLCYNIGIGTILIWYVVIMIEYS